MPTPIALSGVGPKKSELQSTFSKVNDCMGNPFELETCKLETEYCFKVESRLACVFFYGLEGKVFTVYRKCGDCPPFEAPYPKEAPYEFSEDGCDFLFTKPGRYAVRCKDGSPLPTNFLADHIGLTPEWAMALIAERG